MNPTFVLSVLLALWSGLSWAKDNTGARDVRSIFGRDPYAAVAYFVSPKSHQKSPQGQGRLINWNRAQMPFKNYLFPKVESVDKDAVAEIDVDDDVDMDGDEQSTPDALHFSFYPFPSYYNHGYPHNAYPYAHNPNYNYPYTGYPYPVVPKHGYHHPSYHFPGFPNPTTFAN